MYKLVLKSQDEKWYEWMSTRQESHFKVASSNLEELERGVSSQFRNGQSLNKPARSPAGRTLAFSG